MTTRFARLSAFIIPVLAFAALCGTPTGAAAQYFGRNEVRYKSFDFKVLHTRHFDIYYYPAEKASVGYAARMAERWYARLSRLFKQQLKGRQPFILYASQPDFDQTTVVPGPLGEGTGGVTEQLKRRVVLPMAGPLASSNHVIGHELTHAFQFDIMGITPNAPRVGNAGRQLPLWMIEGMAEYFSLGPDSPLTAMWLRDALAHPVTKKDTLPTIAQLANSQEFFPYRWGQALWAYIGGRFGDGVIEKIYRAALRDGPRRAIRHVLGVPMDTLSRQWHAAIRRAYGPLLASTGRAADFGKPVFPHEKSATGMIMDVSPSLSPGGRRLMFLSSRDLFSVDLFLANARTGRIIRRITETAVNPHLQSLEFINSAGAWSPNGRRFAFPAIVKGRPVLDIINAATGKRIRELHFPSLEEIYSPTWSPDGRRIAFSANDGGLLDLFVADARTGRLRRLTHDPFAEMQPAWSPDGRGIAFVTDRFGADTADVQMGHYRLALIDPASRRITPLRSFDRGKNIDPQWAPGGHTLYFVADPRGISNIYALNLDHSTIRRVTNVLGGVSGITDLSPALSVASRSGRIVFDAFRKGDYRLYRMSARHPAVVATAPSSVPASGALGVTSATMALAPTSPTSSIAGALRTATWATPVPVPELASLRPTTPASFRAPSLFARTHGPSETLAGARAIERSLSATSPAPTAGARAAPSSHAHHRANAVADTVPRIHMSRSLRFSAPPAVGAPPGPPANAGMLPPERRTSEVLSLLHDPTLGLPTRSRFSRSGYAGGMRLDYVAPPQLGAGFSSLGSFVGAATTLHFSDMLGQHDLTTMFQANVVNGNLADGLGALAQYMNRTHRTSWGFIVGQIPNYTEGYTQALVLPSDTTQPPEVLENNMRVWQLQQRAIGLLSYPFSSVQRLELGAGFQRTAYKLQIQQLLYSGVTGQVLQNRTVGAPACGDSLNLYVSFCNPGSVSQVLGTAALVYDDAVYGPMGPILGQRYRFELDPTTGTLTYVGALLDYRRYIMPIRPLTIAARLMGYGRFGGSAEDPRLGELFIGYPSLIRGYGIGTFNLSSCPSGQPLSQCRAYSVYSRLFGTRMAIANIEARLPLLGPLGLVSQDFLPTELIGFFDAGDAWTSQNRASFLGGDRPPLTSAGAGLRIDLFGFTMLEADWVHPFSRPGGGHFLFTLSPAF